MNDRLQQLALFVRTVETGSFSKAARALGLTQPSASRAVAALESRLGVKLIVRTTRQISATDAGEALFARARDALGAIEEAENAARGADRLSGVLRVALPATYGARRIAPLLPAFLERRPLLKIDLMMSDRYENSDRRRGRPRAEARRATGFEFHRAQTRKRKTSLRRRADLPDATGRAGEPRRSCRARRDWRRSRSPGRMEFCGAAERADRDRVRRAEKSMPGRPPASSPAPPRASASASLRSGCARRSSHPGRSWKCWRITRSTRSSPSWSSPPAGGLRKRRASSPTISSRLSCSPDRRPPPERQALDERWHSILHGHELRPRRPSPPGALALVGALITARPSGWRRPALHLLHLVRPDLQAVEIKTRSRRCRTSQRRGQTARARSTTPLSKSTSHPGASGLASGARPTSPGSARTSSPSFSRPIKKCRRLTFDMTRRPEFDPLLPLKFVPWMAAMPKLWSFPKQEQDLSGPLSLDVLA